MVDGKELVLNLWDTAGQEDFEKLRPLSYNNTDVFIVCFSLVSHDSLINVREKWLPELRKYCKGSELILVGTKLDLRRDPKYLEELKANGGSVVHTEDAEELKRSAGFAKYIEVSAKTKENVKKVFDEVVRLSIQKKTKKKPPCSVL